MYFNFDGYVELVFVIELGSLNFLAVSRRSVFGFLSFSFLFVWRIICRESSVLICSCGR